MTPARAARAAVALPGAAHGQASQELHRSARGDRYGESAKHAQPRAEEQPARAGGDGEGEGVEGGELGHEEAQAGGAQLADAPNRACSANHTARFRMTPTTAAVIAESAAASAAAVAQPLDVGRAEEDPEEARHEGHPGGDERAEERRRRAAAARRDRARRRGRRRTARPGSAGRGSSRPCPARRASRPAVEPAEVLDRVLRHVGEHRVGAAEGDDGGLAEEEPSLDQDVVARRARAPAAPPAPTTAAARRPATRSARRQRRARRPRRGARETASTSRARPPRRAVAPAARCRQRPAASRRRRASRCRAAPREHERERQVEEEERDERERRERPLRRAVQRPPADPRRSASTTTASTAGLSPKNSAATSRRPARST